MKNFFRILFAVIAVVTILEYLFIFGMFTGPAVMVLSCLIGAVNAILSFRDKEYHAGVLYVIASVALSMGYWKAMF